MLRDDKVVDKDVEKKLLPTQINEPEILSSEKVAPTAQASGDRALVLMDLNNGLVGWDSAGDPENPQ
ncbi:hypothetical protein SLS60_004226 [Paraconiothyrium brasiliense]|uniref:Uncharacterized protein n=1 Tax=Paraconiothyrium brasiliense TaxID=300254 RepID=A0ABR3RR25_9PLEO